MKTIDYCQLKILKVWICYSEKRIEERNDICGDPCREKENLYMCCLSRKFEQQKSLVLCVEEREMEYELFFPVIWH